MNRYILVSVAFLSSTNAVAEAQYSFEDNDLIVLNNGKNAWQTSNLPIKSALILLPAGVLSQDKLPEDVIKKATKFCSGGSVPQYKVVDTNDHEEIQSLSKGKSGVVVTCDDPSGKEVYTIFGTKADGIKCRKLSVKFGKANVNSEVKTGRNTKQCGQESWTRVGDSVTGHYFYDAAGASLCKSLVLEVEAAYLDHETQLSQTRKKRIAESREFVQSYLNGRLNCDAKVDQVFKLDLENKLKERRQKKIESEKPEIRTKIQSDLAKLKLLDPLKTHCERIGKVVHDHEQVRFGTVCQISNLECEKDATVKAKMVEGQYTEAMIEFKKLRSSNKKLREIVKKDDDLTMCCFIKPDSFAIDYVDDKCVVKPVEYSLQK